MSHKKLYAIPILGITILGAGLLGNCQKTANGKTMKSNLQSQRENRSTNMPNKIRKTEQDWKKELSPEEYEILREKNTERAFTGKYNDHKEKGIYNCAACGLPLFSSTTKYNSGSGWPSFYAPVQTENVLTANDYSHGMTRKEILCAQCGGHLGHVFDDGPKPTGLRYCVNSISLKFQK